MRRYAKLLLVGLTASLLLAMAVSSASAQRLSLNEKGFRIAWQPLEFQAAGSSIRCNVTLEGSFHQFTVAKNPRTLLGYVSRAILTRPCAGGAATVLTATLPWHVTYESFAGRLPVITSIRLLLINAAFSVQPEGSLTCLARTSAANPAAGIAAINGSGVITELTADGAAEIPLTGEFGLCAFGGSGHFAGTATRVTRLGSTGTLVIRLI